MVDILLPSKHPLKSMTIWGGVFAFVPGASQIYMGYVNKDPVQMLEGLTVTVGSLMAILGRINATKPVRIK